MTPTIEAELKVVLKELQKSYDLLHQIDKAILILTAKKETLEKLLETVDTIK